MQSKLEEYIQKHSKSSQKMCHYYCSLLIQTHMTYTYKLKMLYFFKNLENFNQYFMIE